MMVQSSRPSEESPNQSSAKGTRSLVTAFGLLCGITGILAGIFEVLQGNTMADGFAISTIGSSYGMADDFTYHAVTIVPNLLLTGILAIIVSSVVIIWSAKYVERPYGALILFALCIGQMLVGGGWVIDVGIFMCIFATRIGKPLNWWRKHLPDSARHWLARLYPVSLVLFGIIAGSMLVLTVLGVNSVVLIESITPLAGLMFIPMLLMMFGALATDIEARKTLYL
jgi:hypothetical protein